MRDRVGCLRVLRVRGSLWCRHRLPVNNVDDLLQIAFVGDQGYEGC